MIERTQGLILRARPLTDTSLIIHWLTPDLGRIATVAKGARRPKSPFRGKLDFLYLADFSFSRSRRSELHALHEVVLRNTRRAWREELDCLQLASYCVALIEQTTETDTPLPAIFQLLATFLDFLTPRSPRPLAVFAFEMKLLAELGLKPNCEKNKMSPGARKILETAASMEWVALARLKPSEAQTDEIGRFLHGFLIYHLGKIPPGRHFPMAPGWDAG
jgi:DNA repair protein RecO (recombination protein O)